MDCTVGIISRNLATQSNFVEFRDSRNFTYFEAMVSGDTWGAMWMTHGESCGDTWHAMCQHAGHTLKAINMGSQIQFVGGGGG